MATIDVRASIMSYSAREPHEVARLAAARNRKRRAAELRVWG